MNVTVAKSAGFCFGVRRAVDMVYGEAEKSDMPVYTYGPVIHNDEVVADLRKKGVQVIRDLKELESLPKGKIIIRSHGISRAEHESMKSYGFEILDATCPFVQKIHRLVNEYSKKDYAIVIAGDLRHPEVQGILGWVEDTPAFTVQTAEDIEKLPLNRGEKVCFVAQTTFNYNKFQELVEIIAKKGYDIIVLDTICNATEERQAEARTIARQSDVMIVVGDKNSSNTRKLYEISKKECENTYYIQTSNDLDYRQIQSINNVGITAGASTPNYIIEEVSKNVRNEL
jgi:4-hydroxy-3-methylbut-2-enyl diphosphate reductase